MTDADTRLEVVARALAKRENGQAYEGYESTHADLAAAILSALDAMDGPKPVNTGFDFAKNYLDAYRSAIIEECAKVADDRYFRRCNCAHLEQDGECSFGNDYCACDHRDEESAEIAAAIRALAEKEKEKEQ